MRKQLFKPAGKPLGKPWASPGQAPHNFGQAPPDSLRDHAKYLNETDPLPMANRAKCLIYNIN